MNGAAKVFFTDTIAAIATAPGEAGIAVVRVSGPDSLGVADRVFLCTGPAPSSRPSHTVVHGRVRGRDGEILDEALLLLMRAPHSYTGEDVAELQCHGGRMAVARVLRRVLESGARTAEPGEFSRRAFLNGRMDLAQAEGVLDLIRAQSDRAAASALQQLEGRLSRRIDSIYDQLLAAASDVEATLDFPEDELPESVIPELAERIRAALRETSALLSTWTEGRLLRQGVQVVILGRPNVGKSTLFNALLGSERAIVSPIPGTTRDTIEEHLVLGGYPVRLTDTAGLRDSSCEIEREGIRRARKAMETADLAVYVLDGSSRIDPVERALLTEMPERKLLCCFNKCDVAVNGREEDFHAAHTVRVSATHKIGIEELTQTMQSMIAENTSADGPPHETVSERHRELLSRAESDALKALSEFERNEPDAATLASIFLRNALENLGGITGRQYSEELLNSIFSRFCIGK